MSPERPRAPADVAAAKASRPVDLVDRRISALACASAMSLPARRDAEHAPAIGEDAVAVALACRRGRFPRRDRRAAASSPLISEPFVICAGIALRRHHHAKRGVVVPLELRRRSSVPSHVASSAGSRSDLSRSISTWHSGSPKRTLYSMSFGAPFSIISPA